MRMTVSDAREFATVLTSAADAAEKAGATDFDLTSAVQSLDDASRQELSQAIETARSSGS